MGKMPRNIETQQITISQDTTNILHLQSGS